VTFAEDVVGDLCVAYVHFPQEVVARGSNATVLGVKDSNAVKLLLGSLSQYHISVACVNRFFNIHMIAL
jgi:hypothetical protein